MDQSAKAATLVREVMTPDVVSVPEDMQLDAVVRTLDRRNVSCVLVKHADGSPGGVISISDLAAVSKSKQDSPRAPLRLLPPALAARDVMVRDIITVPASAEVGVAAKTLLDRKIHRVFVTDADRIVGVFSTRDAMRVIVARQIETPLREVMTSPVETIGIGETIAVALEKLESSNVRGLAVLDVKVPVGLFTQLEAIKARALPAALHERPVEEAMSYHTVYLDVATPLYRAAGLVIANNARRILVTEERALAGIVSGYDVARVLISG